MSRTIRNLVLHTLVSIVGFMPSIVHSYEIIGTGRDGMYNGKYFLETVLPQWKDNPNVKYILFLGTDLNSCGRCQKLYNTYTSLPEWQDMCTSKKIGVYSGWRGAGSSLSIPGDMLPLICLLLKPTNADDFNWKWLRDNKLGYISYDTAVKRFEQGFTVYVKNMVIQYELEHGTITPTQPSSDSSSGTNKTDTVAAHGWNVMTIDAPPGRTLEGTDYVFSILREGDAKDALTLLIIVDGKYYAPNGTVRWDAGEFGTKTVRVQIPATDNYDDGDNVVISIKSQNRYIKLKQ